MIILMVLPALFTPVTFGQDESTEKDLMLEFEPGLYFYGGRSLLGLYNVTGSNNFAVGAYLMTTEVPEFISKNLLNNVMDSSTIRITSEYALNFRYRFNIFKNYQSNPFVGLILGWENIRIQKPGMADLNIPTFLATPHVGFEFFIYKKMVFLNPQFRSVFYFGHNKSDETRPETINNFILLPSITLGLRL
jgi:hypothetical protein